MTWMVGTVRTKSTAKFYSRMWQPVTYGIALRSTKDFHTQPNLLLPLCGISHYPMCTENAKAQRGLATHPRTSTSHGSMGADPSHWLRFPALFPKMQLSTFMCKIFLYYPNIYVHIRAIKTFCIPLSTFMMMVTGIWYSLRHMSWLSTSLQALLGKNSYQEYFPHTVEILNLFRHDVKSFWELLFINIFLNCLFSYLVVCLSIGQF